MAIDILPSMGRMQSTLSGGTGAPRRTPLRTTFAVKMAQAKATLTGLSVPTGLFDWLICFNPEQVVAMAIDILPSMGRMQSTLSGGTGAEDYKVTTIYHKPYTIYHIPHTIYHILYNRPYAMYHTQFTVYHMSYTIYHQSL